MKNPESQNNLKVISVKALNTYILNIDSDDESKLREELEKYGDDVLEDENELADDDFSMEDDEGDIEDY